jgi:hypothetical protein
LHSRQHRHPARGLPPSHGGEFNGESGDELCPGDPDDYRQGVDEQERVDAGAERQLYFVESGESGGERPTHVCDQSEGHSHDQQQGDDEGAEAAGEVVEVSH